MIKIAICEDEIREGKRRISVDRVSYIESNF